MSQCDWSSDVCSSDLVSLELLARLFSSQLITKGERHLLDHSRVYYRVLRTIFAEGQQRG